MDLAVPPERTITQPSPQECPGASGTGRGANCHHRAPSFVVRRTNVYSEQNPLAKTRELTSSENADRAGRWTLSGFTYLKATGHAVPPEQSDVLCQSNFIPVTSWVQCPPPYLRLLVFHAVHARSQISGRSNALTPSSWKHRYKMRRVWQRIPPFSPR